MLDAFKLYRLHGFKRVYFGYHQYRVEEVHLLFDSLHVALVYVSTELDSDSVWCITRYTDSSRLVARSSFDYGED